MNSFLFRGMTVAILYGVVGLQAQQPEGLAPAPTVSVNNSAEATVAGSVLAPAVGGSPTSKAALRAQVAQLREKGEQAKGTAQRREVAIEEALTLAKLAGDGVEAERQRRHQLVAELMQDEAIPRAKRLEVAATSANVDVFIDRRLTREQKIAKFAAVAWQLVERFPQEPDSYDALVRIARDSDEASAQEIALRLLVSAAPETVKSDARSLLNQLELVGEPLFDLLPADCAKPEWRGRRICLFTWSTRSAQPLRLAAALRARLSLDTILIGVCVDPDAETVRRVAATQTVPTELLYEGLRSELCARLAIDRPGLVYLTDQNGHLASVSGLTRVKNERSYAAQP